MPMAMTMHLSHFGGFILIDISVLIGIHLVEHYLAVARVFVPADAAVLIGIRHGHSTSPLAGLAVAFFLAIIICLAPVVIPLAPVVIRLFISLRQHVTFIQGSRSKWIIPCGHCRCGAKRSGKRGTEGERHK